MNKTTYHKTQGNFLKRCLNFKLLALASLQFLAFCPHFKAAEINVWGYNAHGQLGVGNNVDQFLPQPLSGLTEFTQVAMGSYHALAVVSSGKVMACGNNQWGQLGLGTNSIPSKNKFVVVTALSDIKQVAVGYTHSVAVTKSGKVKVWGSNSYGELGLGDTKQRNFPTDVPGLSNIKSVAAGWNYTVALKEDGTVMAWGRNDSGQLGWGLSMGTTVPVAITGLKQVKQIAVNRHRTAALLENGTVKMWGGCGKDTWFGFPQNDPNGAVRTPTLVYGLSGVKQVTLGFNHAVVLLESKKVKAWGKNTASQLGIANVEESILPLEIPGLSNVAQVGGGDFHTLALLENGTVVAWGYNKSGQAGSGSPTNFDKVTVPKKIERLANVTQIVAGTVGGVAFSK